jgi:SAM-dependent methyltransferase
MRAKLMDILAEPVTGSPLQLEVGRSRGDVIEEGRLVSEQSGKVYPITEGIPRFVPTEGYAGNFGMQWNKFRDVQLDSSTTASRSRRRFDDEAGWTADELEGKWLLDAGCGAGRFAEVAAERGPDLVALDMSSAIDAAKKTLARFDNVDLVQASVLAPPFRAASFDFAYCIGVAQHTPDPPKAVSEVVRMVKPGGRFAMSIYARRPWTKLNAKYLIRPITRRLPDQALLGAITTVMPVLFPVTDVLFRLPKLGRLAQFTIPVATYVEPTDFTDEQRYAEAVLDTFDMLSPRYDSPMTWQEVEAELTALGARSWTFQTRVPINCVGVR